MVLYPGCPRGQLNTAKDERKLKEFAKDNNIPVRSDREKLEKLIVHEISQR